MLCDLETAALRKRQEAELVVVVVTNVEVLFGKDKDGYDQE